MKQQYNEHKLLFYSYFLLYFSPSFIHHFTCLILIYIPFYPLCFFPISPPRSDWMSIFLSPHFFISLIAMILRPPYSSQYELLICQAVERYSGGRLWNRPDPSLWGSDRNSACWGQRPRSLDLLTGHCSFLWTGELYKPYSSLYCCFLACPGSSQWSVII